MVRVEIPESVEGVSALADLKFETEWQLAATVVAWTTTANKGGRGKTGNQCKSTPVYGINEFSRLGIRGLKSNKTVIAYRAAWEAAGGDMNIRPGDAVDIPDADWSDYYGRNAIHGANAKRTEEAAAYRQFPGTAQETTSEPRWKPNPDGSADRKLADGITMHKPSAAEAKAKRESPEMSGVYKRADIGAIDAMIGHVNSYLQRAIDKAEDAGLPIPNLDIVEDYLLTARNHNNKINNTDSQTRPGLRVV